MRASVVLASLSFLVSACGAATTPPSVTSRAVSAAARSEANPALLHARLAEGGAPVRVASPPESCTAAAGGERTSGTRAVSAPPEYPDRSAVEALDALALVTHIDYQPRGAVITLSTDSFFESGASALTQNARWRLDAIATALAHQYNRKIEIRGYTDNLGDAAESAALSLQRATAIRDYVVSKGANPDQIRVEGLGHRNPVADNATAGGRSANRRIEIVIEQRERPQI